MPNTALITGASSGIGREFARYHASTGGDLIITARRAENLEQLKAEIESEHNVSVTTIALDLGAPDGAKRLYDAVTATGLTVDILINNAGFGGHGAFLDRNLQEDLAIIQLNISALISLCHMFGRDMAERGSGKILNVSSTAAHMPGPLQATYFATKSFVSSFSQALAEELGDHGVTVTALEPGYVHTEFTATANMEGTGLSKLKGSFPASVAKCGYDAMTAGKLTVINEKLLAFQIGWIMPFLPARLKLKQIRRMQEK